MIKLTVFSFLLFPLVLCAQTVSSDESFEYLIARESQSVSDSSVDYENFSSTVRTSSLNGKIELGGLLLLKAQASLLLEFEQPIFNSHLMWLLQVGGGAFASHHASGPKSGSAEAFNPYASVHTGFRYRFISDLTFSMVLGTRTFENTLWSAASLGWDIMNKIHVEIGLAAIYIMPIMLNVSVSIPIKTW